MHALTLARSYSGPEAVFERWPELATCCFDQPLRAGRNFPSPSCLKSYLMARPGPELMKSECKKTYTANDGRPGGSDGLSWTWLHFQTEDA